jgi:hypothetical protein
MTRQQSRDEKFWYVPLLIAAAVVVALLMAGVAVLEVFAARLASEASDGRQVVQQVATFSERRDRSLNP